jgi:hypothetical protein
MTGRRAWADLGRMWAAVLVAYALLLQAAAPVAPLSAAGYDPLGVICRAGQPVTGGAGDPASHRHDACLVHCAAFTGLAGPEAVADLVPDRVVLSAEIDDPADRLPAPARRGTAQPRAPPSLSA